MKRASVDIGTNTFRLLVAEVAEVDDGGSFEPKLLKRIITRLGGGYTEERGISPEAAERAFKALAEFRALIEANGVEEVSAVATSVVRRAVNKEWFAKEASDRLGFEIKVIGGAEEARLSLLGVNSVVGTAGRKLVMDIGGGSTEFVATEGALVMGAWSLELGVVHLTETFLKSDPPKDAELEAMAAEIAGMIDGLKERMASDGLSSFDFSEEAGAIFVGTAGTVTTLAAIELDMDEYDATLINNHRLCRSTTEKIFNRLASMNLSERAKILAMEKGREDLIVGGGAVLLEVMRSLGFSSMIVSDAGLLEGLLIDGASGQA